MFADRSTGRLGGLNNSESGGVADAKNLRVKVSIWTLHYRLSFFFNFMCEIWLDIEKTYVGKGASVETGSG